MILYHGSNMAVEKPAILQKNKFLDFGFGVYTTTNLPQAQEFASKVVSRQKRGIATVSYYEFDEAVAFEKGDLLKFEHVNKEWLDFVSANRNGVYQGKLYDFVYGAVANDDVFKTIALYLGGVQDETKTLQDLKIKQLFNQLVFCNKYALSFLKFVNSEVVS